MTDIFTDAYWKGISDDMSLQHQFMLTGITINRTNDFDSIKRSLSNLGYSEVYLTGTSKIWIYIPVGDQAIDPKADAGNVFNDLRAKLVSDNLARSSLDLHFN